MKKLLLSTLLIAGLTAQANAQGFYAGGNIGASRMTGLEDYAYGTLQSPGVNSVAYSEATGGLKLLAGIHLNKYFALEAGYAFLGEFDTDVRGTSNYKETWDVGALFVDALVTVPVAEQFSLFAKAGYASTRTEYEFDSPTLLTTTSKTKSSVKWGLGGEFVIAKHYAVRVEYENYPNVGDNNRTALESDISFLSAGFNYKF